MKCNPIPEREDRFITDRKPIICPRCGKKEVRKAVLGYPTEEDFFNDNIYLIGCIPDFPIERTWGCRNVIRKANPSKIRQKVFHSIIICGNFFIYSLTL